MFLPKIFSRRRRRRRRTSRRAWTSFNLRHLTWQHWPPRSSPQAAALSPPFMHSLRSGTTTYLRKVINICSLIYRKQQLQRSQATASSSGHSQTHRGPTVPGKQICRLKMLTKKYSFFQGCILHDMLYLYLEVSFDVNWCLNFVTWRRFWLFWCPISLFV